MQAAHGRVMQEVRRHFRPKLLDRLDEVVVLEMPSYFLLKGIELIVTHAAYDFILTESYDAVGGVTLYLSFCYRIPQKI
jgi:ATP-dependent Clp protease ATP-binding subunit ClpB